MRLVSRVHTAERETEDKKSSEFSEIHTLSKGLQHKFSENNEHKRTKA